MKFFDTVNLLGWSRSSGCSSVVLLPVVRC